MASSTLTRLRKSLRHRGALATLTAAAMRVDNALYDLRRGMWTVNQTNLDDLTIVGDRRGGVGYAPSGARSFLRALHHFDVPTTGRFVDFGCGKGRALILALDYGFEEVLGIEYAAELHQHAKRVLARNHRRAGWRRADVLLADARRYPVDPIDRVFYLFNPFGADVFAEVLENLERSLAAAPREAWLVYANPEHRHLIERSPVWTAVGERRFAGGMQYACFRTRTSPDGHTRSTAGSAAAKASPLRLTADNGFLPVTGIEFDPRLINVAHSKLRTYVAKLPQHAGVMKVFHQGAADYHFPTGSTVVMVNSFGENLARLSWELAPSPEQSPRKSFAPYFNAVYRGVLDQFPLLQRASSTTRWTPYEAVKHPPRAGPRQSRVS